MAAKTKIMAASVHQRLLNKARESSHPFNEFLQHFAIERFIYRLSKSPHADRFVLKGALMFSAWTGSMSRPTMDIDLLGKIENNLELIAMVVKMHVIRKSMMMESFFTKIPLPPPELPKMRVTRAFESCSVAISAKYGSFYK
jgi:hypothetical protein